MNGDRWKLEQWPGGQAARYPTEKDLRDGIAHAVDLKRQQRTKAKRLVVSVSENGRRWRTVEQHDLGALARAAR